MTKIRCKNCGRIDYIEHLDLDYYQCYCGACDWEVVEE